MLLTAVYVSEWWKEFSPYEALAGLLGAGYLANLNNRAHRAAAARAREAQEVSTDVEINY